MSYRIIQASKFCSNPDLVRGGGSVEASTWASLQGSVETVRSGWRRFQEGDVSVDGVRQMVLHSWRRSRQAGLAPGQTSGLAARGDHGLQAEQSARSELLTAARSVIAELQGFLSHTGQVLALCDPQARALLVEGDPSARRKAGQIHLEPGADWGETASGTNAMGTAAIERRLVTIFASEHYLEELHPWACVAAPICHPLSGEVLGILDLSGQYMSVNRHTEMAVTGAVQAVQSRIALLESTHRHALLEAFADQVVRNRNAPAGLVDRRGYLLRVWGSGLEHLTATPLWHRGAQHVLQAGREYREEFCHDDGRRLGVTFRPVRSGGLVVGAVVETLTLPAGRTPSAPPALDGMVGTNPRWQGVLSRAARAARTDSTVLITGETGTGKEVLARAVHRASNRAPGPFVAVNCGALPPTLAASELFGYVGGAFTGANPKGSAGKVEAAHGGTLFLDEVSELAPEVQIHLLRVLQEREVVRVGTHRAIPVNVRVIAATNKDLGAMVAAGTFRADLFFRLNVVPVALPPLRERREDILPLLEHGYRRLGAEPPTLGLASCEQLTAYSWPGNVRELLNLVEQAVALGEDPADLLPLPPLQSGTAVASLGDAAEEGRIRQALDACGGNAAAAARRLGMSRSTLYRKLELYTIRLGRQVQ